MTLRRTICVAAIAFLALSSSFSVSQTILARTGVEGKIDSLIGLMTMEEKLGQLNLEGGDWTAQSNVISDRQLRNVRAGRIGAILNVFGAEVTATLQKAATRESRLKIPLLFGLDVIHGFRTTFPIPLAEASTWDPLLVERAARVAATEASATGIDWTFAPMVDIARDPRWGRIAEGSGEDPYLGSEMAAAHVRGFQGNDLTAPTGVLACAKHYVAYGGAEGGRDYNTVDISERTLREIYLPPFRAAVDAGAGTLMSAFNEIGGIPSTANAHTLTEILRGEWGFKGFVVSDWGSVGELIQHGVARDSAEAGLRAITAGVDLDMASGIYARDLSPLIKQQQIPTAVVDEAVRRVLREKFRLGLFDDPFRQVTPEREASAMLTSEAIALARQEARESIVLLKNEKNLLPLSRKLKTVALIGPLADDKAAPLGPWDGLGRPEDVVSVFDGITHALGSVTSLLHASGCDVNGDSKKGFGDAVEIARRADVAILVLGETADMSGEAASRSDIGLPGVQEELLEAVAATGTPLVLILMNGRPLTISWAAEHVQAILETWFLGVQTGNAIADIVFGDFNPGGKLPVSFPRSLGQIPIYYDHKNTGRPPSDDHYTSKYTDLPSTPMYPFGYGLSYTTFSYVHARADKATLSPHDTIHVAVEVKNAGNRSGEEVVQLYIHRPWASVTRPVRELKRFRRISLAPGEVRTIEFSLAARELEFYDTSMHLVLEPGPCEVFVGGNSVGTLSTSFQIAAP